MESMSNPSDSVCARKRPQGSEKTKTGKHFPVALAKSIANPLCVTTGTRAGLGNAALADDVALPR